MSMSDADVLQCVALLDAADRILLDSGEHMLAARLSMVVETLRERAAQARIGRVQG
jgi:hypothetical protein